MPTACFMSSLSPGDILPFSGIDDQFIPFVDKEGHLHDQSRLQLSGFGAAGGRIAANPGIGFHHFQFHRIGKLHPQRLPLIGDEIHIHVLLQKLDLSLHIPAADRHLVVGFIIHKSVVPAAFIKKLHLTVFHMGSVHLFPRSKSLFRNVTVTEVTQFGANKSRSFAGFHMLKIHDLPYITVQLNGQAGTKIVCRNQWETSFDLVDDHQFFGTFRQHFMPLIRNHDIVFNADTAHFGKVYARLHRHHHPRLQRGFTPKG